MRAVGIIAEDDSDVAVIAALTATLVNPAKVREKHFVGRGCGPIQRKCARWAQRLVERGCEWIVVVRDLDQGDESAIRSGLERELATAGQFVRVVLIPRRAIEAWLLFDEEALKTAFGSGRPCRLPPNPESLDDPKEKLGELVAKYFGKQYVNTVHNKAIAARIRPERLRMAASFSRFPPFAAIMRAALLYAGAGRPAGGGARHVPARGRRGRR